MNLDIVPSSLEQAVKVIIDDLKEDELDFIQNNSPVDVHFSFGAFLRNAWSLWDTETILVQHFLNKYNIGHADDISSLILDCVWRQVKGQKWEVEKHVDKCHKHWLKFGLPENGIERE